ncbi:phosphoglycerate kinase [Ruficoccus amylovorans]|uniref:Phosphoglycerate kinase n=1 Tax=Ruficoccus amylovorans TaxID=1804625 RepID=A0A842HD96_9BACT|nr:phosphoglycerate kinase [Ruficoccus amylovorans]MBC2594200.1 phosphoglycerate kinase [Ruficoccus amylovorans]
MASVKTIKDVNLAGKRVFVRVDFNVPFDAQGNISDDTRIVGALPTIKHLVDQGAKVILASHLGRPKGEKNLKYTLAPVAKALSERLGQPVLFVPDCIGPEAEKAANELADGGVILLENARFYKGEEKNDPEFCQALAKLADAYVNDAFGTAHRAHATTEGITKYISGPKVSGFLIEKELDFLGEKTAKPERPFAVILGGAKVSDKITVIEALLEKCDTMLIGGAMAYTFALAQGKKVGDSLSEPDKIETAKACLAKAEAKGVNFLLPVDTLVTDKLDFGNAQVGETKIVEGDIPDGWQGVDIGPKTIELYKSEVAKAKTILWNGPMGVFEIKECAKGTFAVAEAVAEADAISIIGGGDSVKAIKKSGYGDKVSFISTGGGASLEFLEGKTLPGVAALEQA